MAVTRTPRPFEMGILAPVTPPRKLRYVFEWGGGCLWADGDAALDRLGFGPLDCRDACPLPMATATLERCRRLGEWHDASLNWDYPPDPGPWRQGECDLINAAADELLADIRRELGPDFEVTDARTRLSEDPDLGRYLVDPAGFRRGVVE